jgi:hypothetical protein
MMFIDQRLHIVGLMLKLIYSLVGLLVGLVCVIIGAILCWHGVTGNISWTAKIVGVFDSNMSDAPPGAILFVVGLVGVWFTTFKVRDEIEFGEKPNEKQVQGQVRQGTAIAAPEPRLHSEQPAHTSSRSEDIGMPLIFANPKINWGKETITYLTLRELMKRSGVNIDTLETSQFEKVKQKNLEDIQKITLEDFQGLQKNFLEDLKGDGGFGNLK